ncbi:MAG: class I SAM-dependent methyltransferase, partial [Planctomyces sp.]
PAGSRKNIGAHYDLGNDFFRLWLDDSMAYSSAIFPGPESTLLEGSQEKFDRVCRKLDLQPTDHLLEIGTGWGGLAVHAAKHYGCRVTTTTISRQQAEIAAERIQESGVADRVTLLREDYRELTGKYDKLVSIEMIEAVGHRFMDEYLGKCSDLLKPEGTALLQAIVMPEQRFEQYLRSVDFIQRYIFPGGCLPSIASVLDASGRSTDFRLVHAEDFAPHYAATLRHWKEGFESQKDSILKLGYSEQFVRLWRYYLCYCEAVFEERQVGVVHLQFDKPLTKRDPINLSAMASRPQSTGLSSLSSDMLRNSASSEKQDSR